MSPLMRPPAFDTYTFVAVGVMIGAASAVIQFFATRDLHVHVLSMRQHDLYGAACPD